MDRKSFTLASDRIRGNVMEMARRAPQGTRVLFKDPKRSDAQNDRMWSMLADISKQKTHHGLRLSKEDWKLLFMDALGREKRMVPNLDGNGFVALGRSSSDLGVREMSDLIEILFAWGAQNDVRWTDPALIARAAA